MLRHASITAKMSFAFAALLLSCLLLPADAPAQDEQAEEEAPVELEELDSSANAAPAVVACYLGVEFTTARFHTLLLRIDVDDESMALVGPGEKSLAQYPEGMRKITITSLKTSGKKGGSEKFALELRPFVYTKLVIAEIPAKKAKKVRLSVKIFENGEQVRTHNLNF